LSAIVHQNSFTSAIIHQNSFTNIEKYKPKLLKFQSLNYFYNQVTNKIKIQEYEKILQKPRADPAKTNKYPHQNQ
jgi:hypothetical protein